MMCGATGAANIDDAAITRVHEYFNRLEKLGFAGAVLVSQHGRPLLAEGYGLADREAGTAWTPGTVSTIGSITKQFTGAAVLVLQQDGKLSVADSLEKHFKNVPNDKRDITLHQLLTHSSGIVDLAGVGDWDPITREDFIRRILDQPLEFQPGTDYAYSNAGYSLLGAIIEQLTGETYERFLRRRLLQPAGLHETGYILPFWGKGRIASAYTGEDRWGTVLERPMADSGPHWVLRANGGIHSTAYDMLRWADALVQGRALTAASLDTYWTPHVDEGDGDSFYGYGWVIQNFGGMKVATHNGSNGYFFTDMAIVPDAGIVVFLQTNVLTEFATFRSALGTIGATLLGGAPMPKVPDVAISEAADLAEQDDATELAAFAGRFELEAGGTVDVAVEGDELRLVPRSAEAFARLLSTRGIDLDRARRLSGRIDTIVGAYLKGDWAPLWEAQGQQPGLEGLRKRGTARVKRDEDKYGALQGHEIVGTAFRDGRDVTLVRLRYEHGTSHRTYVWDAEEQERLLGESRRGVADALRVVQETGGTFATWDARTGTSRPVVFESEGAVRFRLGDGIVARRTRSTN